MTSHEKQAAKKAKAQRTPLSGAGSKENGTQRQNGGVASGQKSTDKGASGGKAEQRRSTPRKTGGRAKVASRERVKRDQRQPDSKSAIVLSATVFVLCMMCLAAGFYLSSSSYTDQTIENTLATHEPTAREVSLQPDQESQPSPAVSVVPDDTPLQAEPPLPIAGGSVEEDLALPEADGSAPKEAGALQEKEALADEMSTGVQPLAEKHVAKADQTGGTAVRQESAKVQERRASSPVKANKGKGFAIPPAKNRAILVFIIDDGGYSTAHLEKYTSLPFPVAVAVLPRLPHSVQCAQIVRSSGQELMLHQPMQAKNLNVNPGEGAVLPSMSSSEIYDTVAKNLREIGPVRGMNNHEGSLITADATKIAAVLEATKDAGVYFLDSRTSADTVAPQVAAEKDMKILQRDVFIDDIISEDEMLKQILRGLDIANKNGQAVMIGHVDKSAAILPSLLKRMHPELVKQGYVFAFPSELLR